MAKKKRPSQQEEEVDHPKSTPNKFKETPSTKQADSDSSPSLSAKAMQTTSLTKATDRTPWSLNDQRTLLKAVEQYKLEKGSDPCCNWAAFKDYMQKSESIQLEKEPTKSGIMKKVNRFKNEYKKTVGKRNEGKEHVPFRFFDLCDKVWGDENQKKEAIVDVEKVKGKKSNSEAGLGLPLDEPLVKKQRMSEQGKGNEAVLEENELNKDGDEEEKEDDGEKEKEVVGVREDEGKGKKSIVVMEKYERMMKYPLVFASMEEQLAFTDHVNEFDMKKVCKEIMGKVDEKKLKELECRWKKVKKAEKVDLQTLYEKKALEIEEINEWADILKR